MSETEEKQVELDSKLEEKEDNANENNEVEVTVDVDDTENWVWVLVFDNILPPKDSNGMEKSEDSKEMKKFQKLKEKRVDIFNNLRDPGGAGLNVSRRKVDKSGNAKMYLLIGADDERLEAEAERIELPMKLKAEYGGAYAAYERSKKHLFQINDPANGQFFRKLQKIQLIESIMEAPLEDQGAGLSLIGLSRNGYINKYFPLHEKEKKDWLMDNWGNPRKNLWKPQPIRAVRNYFGEEVAIYFAWLGFYSTWLWIASGVGLVAFIFWIVARVEDTKNWKLAAGWIQAIYSIFLALWATLFLEYWKRYQSLLAHEWGMDNYEEQERPRAEYEGVAKPGLYYKGEWIQPPWGKRIEEKKTLIEEFGTAVGVGKELAELKNVFEGKREDAEEVDILDIPTPVTEYYPTPYRYGKIVTGIPMLITMLLVVVIATFGVLSFRLFVSRRQAAVGSFIGGILNAMLIMFLNQVWRRVAEILTRWENHRTMTSYYDQLIVKIFMFQFVNSYTSLYYIAFFKNGSQLFGDSGLEDECKNSLGESDQEPIMGNGCIDDLLVQVLTLLGTNIVFGQTREVILPWALSKIRFILFKRQTKMDEDEQKHVPRYQKEAALQNYMGTFDEYNEMVIQYGYITLFAAAFPLAPFMALINNMVEIRTDAVKFLTSITRPAYRGARDIGTWYGILEAIGAIAVVTNCLLIAYALIPIFDLYDYNEYHTLATAVVVEHAVFLTKFIIAYVIPDQKGIVRKEIAKQEYIKDQTYKKLQDHSEPQKWHNKLEEEPLSE